jgi:autotransporter-associated beta strand protein
MVRDADFPKGFNRATLYLNRLVTGTTGGTVSFDVNAAPGRLYFSGAGAGATINGNTNWNGVGNALVNASAALADFTIAPAVMLSCNAALSEGFRILGGGTLYVATPANKNLAIYTVSQGRLHSDDLSVTTGNTVLGLAQPKPLTLDGGALQYTGPTASPSLPIPMSAVGGAAEASNAATTLTLTGPVGPAAGSAAGALVKTGPGVLILNNLADAYAGGITVSGGGSTWATMPSSGPRTRPSTRPARCGMRDGRPRVVRAANVRRRRAASGSESRTNSRPGRLGAYQRGIPRRFAEVAKGKSGAGHGPCRPRATGECVTHRRVRGS